MAVATCRKHLARESAHLVLNKALSQCKRRNRTKNPPTTDLLELQTVLIAIKSRRGVEKLSETNKKLAINEVENRAKIVNILIHQEIYGKGLCYKTSSRCIWLRKGIR